MEKKQEVKISMAEAITKAMWIKGLITTSEREKIDQNSRKKLAKAA